MNKTELAFYGFMAKNGLNPNACNGNAIKVLKSIVRLAKQHEKQCVNSCNGSGVVRGQIYYTGTIDEYAKREYGYNVKSAYVSEDVTVFDRELETISREIERLCSFFNLKVEFQSDPRGNTVKLFRSADNIMLPLWELF